MVAMAQLFIVHIFGAALLAAAVIFSLLFFLCRCGCVSDACLFSVSVVKLCVCFFFVVLALVVFGRGGSLAELTLDKPLLLDVATVNSRCGASERGSL